MERKGVNYEDAYNLIDFIAIKILKLKSKTNFDSFKMRFDHKMFVFGIGRWALLRVTVPILVQVRVVLFSVMAEDPRDCQTLSTCWYTVYLVVPP